MFSVIGAEKLFSAKSSRSYKSLLLKHCKDYQFEGWSSLAQTQARCLGCSLRLTTCSLHYAAQFWPVPSSPKLTRVLSIRCQDSAKPQQQGSQEWPYLNPLLLAFFASQRRSALAAKSLVLTAIDLYQQGFAWKDIQFELKIAGIREGQAIEKLHPKLQKKARLLVDLEKDVLLQWIGLIYMTLDELHVEKLAEANPAIDAPSQMILGMKGFVKHTLSLGFTSERLALEQQVALDDWGEALPSVKLMQENARLIVLTKEVVSLRGQAEASEREGLEGKSLDIEEGNTQSSPMDENQEIRLIGNELPQRAARSLLAFLGAAQGSQYSVNAFVEELFSCYLAGWSASELDSALSPEDFVCGKSLFPIAAASGTWQVHAEIFGHWVSTVYITLAQVGVPHKAAESGLGWAWAGSDKDDDAIAANRLSHMVSTALADKAKEKGMPAEVESQALQAVKDLPPASQLPRSDHRFAVLQDPSISETSSAVGLMSQLINLVQLTERLAEQNKRSVTNSG